MSSVVEEDPGGCDCSAGYGDMPDHASTCPKSLSAERKKADRDVLLYGMGVMRSGKHVPLEEVSILLPPARKESKA